ncbi:hypothetical protein NECAME_18698, partial [Necator americanus]
LALIRLELWVKKTKGSLGISSPPSALQAYVHRLPRTAGIAINSTSITGSYKSAVFSVGGDEPILELQTPTCSYRMGVYDVGYGFVQLEHSSDNEKFIVSFSILWLSSRFYALILYAIVLSVGFLILVIKLILTLFSKRLRYHL